ncbi:hypothetical protein C8R45DRAFT_1073660 [Mycena sanguinolenta]|nr:hypothetical protein C8R45DRAFT_1073660 [Mycena sanguinolenta]
MYVVNYSKIPTARPPKICSHARSLRTPKRSTPPLAVLEPSARAQIKNCGIEGQKSGWSFGPGTERTSSSITQVLLRLTVLWPTAKAQAVGRRSCAAKTTRLSVNPTRPVSEWLKAVWFYIGRRCSEERRLGASLLIAIQRGFGRGRLGWRHGVCCAPFFPGRAATRSTPTEESRWAARGRGAMWPKVGLEADLYRLTPILREARYGMTGL